MKSNRLALFALLMVALLGLAACGSNESAKTEAEVFLSQNITQGPADVNMAVSADVVIPNMSINSHSKSPTVVLSQQDDVILTQWVVTCTRTDGGTTVIGGIYQFTDNDQRNGIPGLNKLPIIGALFRNKAVSTQHDELLIFITPRIVKY